MQHTLKIIIILQKEVIMKTKLFLIAAIAVMVPLQTQAAVSVDKTTDETYLKNQGFSAQTAEIISVTKARAAGEEYYTKDEQAFRNQNKFVRFWRKLYVYTDPAAEDYSLYHHDNQSVPKYYDL